eukprot:Nitzschia sp. Nitz4//scaffold42_size132992//93964//94461//NITZ4_003411-RA/size132992-augustus-gene-0.117-mRNA-1//-1//CDS//3329551754//9087//frame0
MTNPEPSMIVDERSAIVVILLAISVSILGLIAIYFQCKQLSRKIESLRQTRRQRGRDATIARNPQPLAASSKSLQLRRENVDSKLQTQTIQTAMEQEVARVKKMQTDVKAQLAKLQSLVEEKKKSGDATPLHHEKQN